MLVLNEEEFNSIDPNAWWIDWYRLCKEYKLSESFITKYQDKLDQNNISCFQNLSEDFIIKHKDKLNWRWISRKENLSINFVKEFKNKLEWYYISQWKNLSEEFIREFKNELDWSKISFNYKFSEEFIEEMQDKIYFPNLVLNKNINLKAYDKEMQNFLLSKLFYDIKNRKVCKSHLTYYMQKQYKKLNVFS